MFKLVISDDEGTTTVVPIVRDEITIGRKDGNTIRLTERNVSRRHARLVRSNGAFLLEDLQSYNGVKLNGARIKEQAKVEAGDAISIGDYQLALEAAAAAIGAHDGDAVTVVDAVPGAGPPARLVMLSPPAPGAEYALSKQTLRIGRAEDQDIWINHRSISNEHAEIVHDGGSLYLVDLGSTNGVRLNGEDVSHEKLRSGDVVELGHVRFRYVGAGEEYAFDADRTVQMDALSLPLGGQQEPKRKPIALIAGLVGLVVIAGLLIALMGGEDDGGEDPGTVTPLAAAQGEGPEPAAGNAPARADEEVSACRAAIEAGDYEEALAAAGRAETHVAGHAAAATCREDATATQLEAGIFERGRAALASGEIDEAFFSFGELPTESSFLGRPEVAQASEQYAASHLELARQALADDPVEAIRQADSVLATPGIGRDVQREARRIRTQAGRRGPVASNGAMAGMRSGMMREPSSMDAPPPPTVDALDQARACLRQGNNQCVVQALEGGRARNAQALSLLIETYRTMGNTRAAVRHMSTFVRRYPSDRRAARYQAFLQQHGG
ncbi:MAG: FHA domain-containing protein [Myxococcales bacterium]|nr:FHA domain-containing protein [Myxococcales bacterium]